MHSALGIVEARDYGKAFALFAVVGLAAGTAAVGVRRSLKPPITPRPTLEAKP